MTSKVCGYGFREPTPNSPGRIPLAHCVGYKRPSGLYDGDRCNDEGTEDLATYRR
jgi:hypothetical protein